jgi:nicotinate-nucleotide pyrophosphorylase (carboxylating)
MPTRLSRRAVLPLIRAALREDRAARDITSRVVLSPQTRIRARILAKTPGVLAGGPLAAWTFTALQPSLRCRLLAREGQTLRRGQSILLVSGSGRAIFAAERTALNLLGHLSGIATLTNRFVRRIRPHRARILDTRKTLPGLRELEKYAVRIGGGHSHRRDLAEAVLIKTTHLHAGPRAARGRFLQRALRRARRMRPRRFVEVEVATLQDLALALKERPDAILLDNWSPEEVRAAVALRGHLPVLLEASGGVTLANVRRFAAAGVNRISVGQLTHSAPALDVSLEVLPDTRRST